MKHALWKTLTMMMYMYINTGKFIMTIPSFENIGPISKSLLVNDDPTVSIHYVFISYYYNVSILT